jgi:hypothetical protein
VEQVTDQGHVFNFYSFVADNEVLERDTVVE